MIKIINSDCRKALQTIKKSSIDCCITSPPYWNLRDYGTAEWVGGDPNCDHQGEDFRAHAIGSSVNRPKEIFKYECKKCGAVRGKDNQIGLEDTPDQFIKKLVGVFREVKRTMKNTGTLWINMGDSYYKKELLGMPWRFALAMQQSGWYLRQDIIWHKPNPLPESAKDRCTKAHEYLFLFSKSRKYHFDYKAIKEVCIDGESLKNKRSVWTIPSDTSAKEGHFATYPQGLVEPCVLAGSPKNGVVLDPFAGTGTTGVVAEKHGRDSIMIELSKEYVKLMEKKIGRFNK